MIFMYCSVLHLNLGNVAQITFLLVIVSNSWSLDSNKQCEYQHSVQVYLCSVLTSIRCHKGAFQ